MNKLQLSISTNIEKELPEAIIFNFDEIKKELSLALKKYQNLVVTEDAITEAKATRADLNRLKKAINDGRIQVGKQWNKPYDEFKKKCDELIGMIDDPTAEIDKQIKEFEEFQKAEKKADLMLVYSEYIGDIAPLISFEKLFDPKWLNKSVSLQNASQELMDKIFEAQKDIKIIVEMKTECESVMIDKYAQTLSMSEALAEKTRFEESQKQIQKLKNEIKDIIFPNVPEEEILFYNAPVEEEETKEIAVVFFNTTKAFRLDMKAITTKHNIKYRGIREWQ
jgi:hypothetical protein